MIRKNKNSKLNKILQRYAQWRSRLPRKWRIVFDIVSTAAVIGILFYAVMIALGILVVLAPLLLLAGMARGSGGHSSRQSQQDWEDDNDPRGNGPHSMAPDYFDH